MSRRQTGFTLVELLVVIAIIGILAGLIFPVFSRARERARQAACVSNLQQFGIILKQYALDHKGKYPMVINPGVLSNAKLVCPNDRRGLDFTYANDSIDGTDPARNTYNYFGYLDNGYADDGSTYDVSGPVPPAAGVTSWRDFPFLRTLRPPSYTIITHCTFHRRTMNIDLALRADGSVDRINHVMINDADARDETTWTDGSKYRFNWVACRDVAAPTPTP